MKKRRQPIPRDTPKAVRGPEGKGGVAKTSAETSVVKAGQLVPQPHGGALSVGNPGNKGGGRPPDEFKRAMAELASSDDMLAHVQKVLNNPDHPQWLGAWKWATERGYGKIPDIVSGPGGGAIPVQVTIRLERPDADADG